MKFENAIVYNGKFYRAGEEVPVAEKIEDSADESTTVEKVRKRRTKAKTEVN